MVTENDALQIFMKYLWFVLKVIPMFFFNYFILFINALIGTWKHHTQRLLPCGSYLNFKLRIIGNSKEIEVIIVSLCVSASIIINPVTCIEI